MPTSNASRGGQVDQHATLDDIWNGNPPGQDKVQRNARALFELVQHGQGDAFLRATPVSNVVFVRCADEERLAETAGIGKERLVSLYWRVHETVLSVIQPEVVIVHGSGISNTLAKPLGLLAPERRSASHGAWNLYAWRMRDCVLVALPNLSRYKPNGGTGQPQSLREFFQEFSPRLMIG